MGQSVLHISAADAAGGAARSAFRIHTGLRALGWTSRMLVGQRRTDDPDVRPLKRNLAWRAADRACGTVTDRLDLQYVFYPSSFGVARDPWFRDAELVQLYNVHGHYFSHSALPFLSRRRPIVWRLSDMWAMTGHVTYSYDCERWRAGCGSCPYLGEYPRLRRDTTALLFRWKQALYRRSRLTLVAPSHWLEGLARQSPLLSHLPLRRIPNGVDLEVYRPRSKQEARRSLGLDPDRPVVLFSSIEHADRRKGGAVLAAALESVDDLGLQLAVLGPDGASFHREVAALGTVRSDERLALAYAAADVFVLPALAENLPNVAVEAIACGTPVVASRVGGIPEVVRDGETGLLVAPGDPEELARAIRRAIEDPDLRARLGRQARAVAEAEFGARREAEAFAALYEELLAA